jgi:GT2 family glycosyltransferase
MQATGSLIAPLGYDGSCDNAVFNKDHLLHLERDRHMTISVVIVSYNTKTLLIACLRALYSSQGIKEPLQVIVVDNASQDGSVEAVRVGFPQVEVIAEEENLGFSKANNIGLERSNGKYILLLNPDTVVNPDVLRIMEDYISEHSEVGVLGCKLITPDGKLDLACRRKFPSAWDGFCRATGLSDLFPQWRLFGGYNLRYLDENKTYPVDCVNGAFMFCRREAVLEVGLMDEAFFMYAEDIDWCYRFKQAGWQIVYHPAATTLHVKGASSSTSSNLMIRELFRSNEIFYRKHYFNRAGLLGQFAVISGLRIWMIMTLVRNSLHKRKKARP